jgi:hypothetical protein
VSGVKRSILFSESYTNKHSFMRVTLVFSWTTATWTQITPWNVVANNWLQANLCCLQRVYAVEADIPISYLLLPDVSTLVFYFSSLIWICVQGRCIEYFSVGIFLSFQCYAECCSSTVISTLQNRFVWQRRSLSIWWFNSVVSYSTLQLTLLLIVGLVSQGAGI